MVSLYALIVAKHKHAEADHYSPLSQMPTCNGHRLAASESARGEKSNDTTPRTSLGLSETRRAKVDNCPDIWSQSEIGVTHESE